jgi:hypothetical protein
MALVFSLSFFRLLFPHRVLLEKHQPSFYLLLLFFHDAADAAAATTELRGVVVPIVSDTVRKREREGEFVVLDE